MKSENQKSRSSEALNVDREINCRTRTEGYQQPGRPKEPRTTKNTNTKAAKVNENMTRATRVRTEPNIEEAGSGNRNAEDFQYASEGAPSNEDATKVGPAKGATTKSARDQCKTAKRLPFTRAQYTDQRKTSSRCRSKV